MAYSLDILNNIRANASEEYQARIPVATRENITTIGNALQTYEVLFNEFSTLLMNKIGKTLIETKLFKNKLARFKQGAILNQQDVEEIFVEMAKSEGAYDPAGPNPLGRRETQQDKVIYHRMNRQDVYVISLGDLDFVRVFRSPETLDAYLAGKLNSLYSGAAYDEWIAMKNLIGTYEGYFDYEVPAITAATAETAAKTFVKTLRKAAQDVGFASTAYNKAGVKTWTDPEKLVLLANKDVVAEVDVEVLAKAFNMGKTNIQVEVITMDDFGPMTDTYGILMDEGWFRVWDTLFRMTQQRNEHGLFTNFFLHVHQIISASTFKNAIRFKVAAA